MAGDWIPASVDLTRKREVLALSEICTLSRHEVAGRLMEFWGWASGETDDGLLVGITVRLLSGLFPDTCPAGVQFWSEVVRVGWLIETPNGLRIPNAEHWITKGAKARLLDARRKRAARGAPVRPKSGPTSGSEPDSNRTTEEKRTGNTPSTQKMGRGSRRAPVEFALTPERLAVGIAEGFDELAVRRQFARLKDYEFRRPRHDWDAVWRNWVREEADRRRPPRGALGLTAAEKSAEVARRLLQQSAEHDREEHVA